MNIKQLTYTSTSSDGWGNDRIFGVPTKKELEEFNSICCHCSTKNSILEYVYSDGVGIFYRSVPSGLDSSGRNRFYAHGYVFSDEDCDKVFKDYSSFLGENHFLTCEDDEFKESGIFSKPYSHTLKHFDKEILVSAIYEVLFKEKTMEILYEGSDGEALIRTFMNTVYAYIPFQLRKFISFSSKPGNAFRDVSAVESFSSYAKIKFNLLTGEILGLDGIYKDFATAMFEDDEQVFIEKLEKMLKSSSNKKEECLSAAKEVIDELLFESESRKPISVEHIEPLLRRVLSRKKYTGIADVRYLTNILSAMRENLIILSADIDRELCNVFEACDSVRLKDAILSYFVYKYKNANTPVEIDTILSSEQFSVSFKAALIDSILEEATTVISDFIASKAVKNVSFCTIIKEKCSEDSIKLLCEAIAKDFSTTSDKKAFIESLFTSPIFAQIINSLDERYMTQEAFAFYMFAALSSSDNLKKHFSLDKKNKDRFDRLFYQLSVLDENVTIEILKVANSTFHDAIYTHLEKVLAAAKNLSIIERFYKEVLSAAAVSTKDFEEQKKHLEVLGIPTADYITAVIAKYSEFCFYEEERQDAAMKKISEFSGSDSIECIPQIEKIKTSYWKHFNFKNFAFSDVVRVMALKDNEKSLLANALYSLFEYVSGAIDCIEPEIFLLCKENLCSPHKKISRKTQSSILRKLKEADCGVVSSDIEMILLLNYSVSMRSVDFSDIEISEKDLCTYIENCIESESSMLHTGKTIKNVYKYIYKENKKVKNPKSDCRGTYAYALKLIEEKLSYSPVHLKDIFAREHVASVYTLLTIMLSCIGIIAMLLLGNSFGFRAKYYTVLAGYITVFADFLVLSAKRFRKNNIDIFTVSLSVFCVFAVTVYMFFTLLF